MGVPYVCLVASQFPGVTVGGGIARPTQMLASNLRGIAKVSVLLTNVDRAASDETRATWEREALDVVLLDESPRVSSVSPWWLTRQFQVFDWLQRHQPDVVICQEWQGLCALAASDAEARAGRIVTWMHGGTLYDLLGRQRTKLDRWEAQTAELERLQSSLSVCNVSPSRFLSNWYREFGWDFSLPTQHIPYHVAPVTPERAAPDLGLPEEVVAFVGQVSFRKGFDRFCDFLDRSRDDARRFGVAVFGRPVDFSKAQIEQRLRRTGRPFVFRSDMETGEIWSALASHRVLLCVPSRLDNSPGVVTEALSSGHSVAAWQSGSGSLEWKSIATDRLYAIHDATTTLELDFPSSDLKPIDFAKHNAAVTEMWANVISSVLAQPQGLGCAPTNAVTSANSAISVVIPTRNRHERAIDLCRRVAAAPRDLVAEIIVVDDSSCPSVEQYVESHGLDLDTRVRILRMPTNSGPGAARNFGTTAAQSPLVLYMDDDNEPDDDHILRLRTALLETGADIIVASLRICEPDSRIIMAPMLGAYGTGLSTIDNVVGDSNFLARRQNFASVGFPESWPSAQEDWAALLTAIRRGLVVRALATPSVSYNRGSGVQRTHLDASSIVRVSSLLSGLPGGWYPLAAQGMEGGTRRSASTAMKALLVLRNEGWRALMRKAARKASQRFRPEP